MDDIENDEVDRTKAQIKASLVMSLESASSRCDQIARQFFAFGEVPDITHFVAMVDEVTADDLKALAEPVLSHRVFLKGGGDATDVIASVMAATPVDL